MSLDVDSLWSIAEKKTRFSLPRARDLHVEGLKCLALALEAEKKYNIDGVRLLQREIFAWMLAHLNFARDQILYREIPTIPVWRPLFIVGFGRSGSTLLHNLLALDANARTPLLWELWAPSPPPHPDSYTTDPRIGTAQRRLDAFDRMAPLIRQVHPMIAQAPDECHLMMRHSQFAAMLYRVPDYWAWLKQLSVAELHEFYAYYRLQVQHLQLFCHRAHWLSKSFGHLHYLPVLLDVFPDAKIIRLHRHPCHAIPSMCSLAVNYRSIFSDRVDHHEVGKTMLDIFVEGMTRAMAFQPSLSRQQVIDIHFSELVADPISIVHRIYELFGYPYTPTFARTMELYLERERHRKKEPHVYALEQFGLSRAEVIERSSDYLAWKVHHAGGLADA